MVRLVEWLAARRRLTLLLVVVYSALVILTHEMIQQIVLSAYDRFGRENFDVAVHVSGILLIAALGRFFWRSLRPPEDRRIKLAYLIITAALIAGSWKWLFFTDAEAVHFPQYAILAILIFPLTRRFGRAVFYATLIGVVDECVQFYVSHPTWAVSLDLNDMIYNLVGAGLGCVLLYIDGAGRLVRRTAHVGIAGRVLRSVPFWITAGIVGLCLTLWLAGMLTIDPLADGTKPKYVLRRSGPPKTFWITTSWGSRYHELSPVEALLVGATLLLFYARLDVFARCSTSARVPSG